jgi:hypothetical protein
MPEWLSDLEKVLASLTPHNDFRLFLTSEAHDMFPPVLLRQCLKIAYEAPPGVKKNMARTFDNWKEDGRFFFLFHWRNFCFFISSPPLSPFFFSTKI